MDGGPFRMQRSADRGAVNRPESRQRQPAEPQVAPQAEPAPASQPAAPRRAPQDKKPTKRWLRHLVVALIVILVVVAGWVAWSTMRSGAGAAIDDSKYQAVSITDGQIYFGKLSMLNDDYVKLTNAYYLQAQPDTATETDPAQQPEAQQNDVKLIKLSNKIYGPENEIVIAKDQIVSYENLSPDGQVAKWLDQNDAN